MLITLLFQSCLFGEINKDSFVYSLGSHDCVLQRIVCVSPSVLVLVRSPSGPHGCEQSDQVTPRKGSTMQNQLNSSENA